MYWAIIVLMIGEFHQWPMYVYFIQCNAALIYYCVHIILLHSSCLLFPAVTLLLFSMLFFLIKSVLASLCMRSASCSGKSRPDWVANSKFSASVPAFRASDTAAVSQFYDKLRPRKTMGSDAEHMDALLHFFYGKFDGVAMELGAVDGNKLSETKIFVDTLGWRRILVEANPLHRSAMSNMSHAFAACAAVCAGTASGAEAADRVVHFVQNRHESGILEFSPNRTYGRASPICFQQSVSILLEKSFQ